MSDLDKLIDSAIDQPNAASPSSETTQQTIATTDPIDSAIDGALDSEDYKLQGAKLEGAKRDPVKQPEVARIAEEKKLPRAFVERNYDSLIKQDKTKKLRDLKYTNPKLATYLDTPDKVAVIHDKLDKVQELHKGAAKLKGPEKDFDLFPAIGNAFKANYVQLKKTPSIVGWATGNVSKEDLAKQIVSQNKVLRRIEAQQPEAIKEFQAKIGKEIIEMDKATAPVLQGMTEAFRGQTLKGVARMAIFGEKAFDETMDMLGLMAGNPKKMAVTSAQSALNSFAPTAVGLATGAAGGAAGLATGVGVGTIYAPGMGTIILGSLGFSGGFVGGFASGTFLTSASLEFAGEFEAALAERKVDLNDEAAVLKALGDPELIKFAKKRALAKGLTTATVDTLFSFVAGATVLKGAKATTLPGKAAKFAKGLAVESVGEGVGEFAGQVAAKGEEASLGEALLEAGSSVVMLGTGAFISTAAVGGYKAIRGAFSKDTAEASQQAKAVYDETQEAKEFDLTLQEMPNLADEELVKRDPELVAGMINNASEDKQVYFQADDWDEHWTNLGENPVEKAEEIIPGGRQALERAREEGSSLAISMGDYVTKVSAEESFGELSKLARRDQFSMNAKEAEAISANIPALLKELGKEAQKTIREQQVKEEQQQAVSRGIEGQLVAAGRDKQEAKDISVIVGVNAQANAELLGEDAIDFAERRRIEVYGPDDTTQDVEKSTLDSLDARYKEVRDKAIALMKERADTLDKMEDEKADRKEVERVAKEYSDRIEVLTTEYEEIRNVRDNLAKNSTLEKGKQKLFQKINRGRVTLRKDEAIAPEFRDLESVQVRPLKIMSNKQAELQFKRQANFKTAALSTYAGRELNNVQSGQSFTIPREVLGDMIDEFYLNRQDVVNERKQGRIRALFRQNIQAVQNLPTLMEDAVHVLTKDNGDKVYYGLGRSDNGRVIGLRFEVRGNTVQKIVPAAFKERPSAKPIDGATEAVQPSQTEDTLSVQDFAQLVNTGRDVRNLLFQKDKTEAVADKIQQDELGFFSKLKEEVRGFNFKKMPADALLKRIQKTEGIKKDEIEETGIEDYLNAIGTDKVSKEEVMQYLEDNGVKIEQLILSEDFEGQDADEYGDLEFDWDDGDTLTPGDYDPYGEGDLIYQEAQYYLEEDEYFIEERIPEIREEERQSMEEDLEEGESIDEEELEKKTMERAQEEAEERAADSINDPDGSYAIIRYTDRENDIEIYEDGNGDFRYGDPYGEYLDTNNLEEAKIRAVNMAIEKGDIDAPEGVAIFTRDQVTFDAFKTPTMDSEEREAKAKEYLAEEGVREKLEKEELEESASYYEDLEGEEYQKELDRYVLGKAEEVIEQRYKNGEYGVVPIRSEANGFDVQFKGNYEEGFTVNVKEEEPVKIEAANESELKEKVLDLMEEKNVLKKEEGEETPARDQRTPVGKAKWETYTVKNAENYREMLLTLPKTEGTFTEDAHFRGYENFVLHARISDRTTKDGKKVFFIEEMQSDWHQQGREKGYQLAGKAKEKAKAELEEAEDAFAKVELQIREKQQSDEYRAKLKVFEDQEISVRNELRQINRDIESYNEDEGEIDYKLREKARYIVRLEEDKQEALDRNDEAMANSYKRDIEFAKKDRDKLFKESQEILDSIERLSAAKLKIRDEKLAPIEKNIAALNAEEFGDLRKEKDELRVKVNKIRDSLNQGVPHAPWKQTDAWIALGMKRLLRMAAEEGYDKIAWTPAKIHIDRWGTDEVSWTRTENGWKVGSVEQRGGFADGMNIEEEARRRGELLEERGEEVQTKEELAEVVRTTLGRERGDRSLDSLVEQIWDQMQDTDTGVKRPRAEGMNFFYNRALPKVAEGVMAKALGISTKALKKSDNKLTLQEIVTEELGTFDVFTEEDTARREEIIERRREVQNEARSLTRKFRQDAEDARLLARDTEEYQKLVEKDEANDRLKDDVMDKIRALRQGEQTEAVEAELTKLREELSDLKDIEFELQEQMEGLETQAANAIEEPAELTSLEAEDEDLRAELDEIEQRPIGSEERFDTLRSATIDLTEDLVKNITKGQPLFQKDDEQARGFTDLSDPEKIIVQLLKDANRSTALHEIVGHAFLENMKIVFKQLQQTPPSKRNARQKQFFKDIQFMLDDFGINSLDEIQTEHHEKFARMVEAYFMEGKAPTKKLQGIFNRFRTWLTAIYRNFAGLKKSAGFDFELTPEWTEVLNRMIMTEEEISEAETEAGYDSDNIIEVFAALGIVANEDSPEMERILNAHQEAQDEATLQLYRKHVEQRKRKLTKPYKAKKKELTEQFKEIAEQSPLYTAIDSIKTHTIKGDEILGYETIKMSTDRLKEILTEEEFKSFPRSLYKKDGLHPDETAQLLGFDTGVDLAKAIVSNPSKSEFIRLSTKRELDRLFPDFMSPEQSKEVKLEALDAVKNDSRAKALQLEMDLLFKNAPSQARQLIRQFAKRAPRTEEIQAEADKRVDGLKFREARPYAFSQAEAKNRKQALEAITKGDYERAAKAKIQEGINYQMFKRASDFNQDFNKKLKKIKDLLRKSDKELAKRGSLDIYKAAQAIMGRYGLLTDAQALRLDQYLAQLQQIDQTAFNKVSGLAGSLIEVDPMSYKDLKVSELRDVMDVVEALVNLAREEGQITVDGKKVDRDKAVNEMLTQVQDLPRESIKKEDTIYKKFKAAVASLKANMTRVEHLIRFLDKEETTGAFRKYIWNRAEQGQIEYETKLQHYYEKLNEVLSSRFSGILDNEEEIDVSKYFPGVDPQLSKIKQYELVMALVHSGNDSNKQKLLLGRNWGSMDMEGVLQTQQYETFLNDMFEQGKITKDMMDGVQELWDLFEEIKPEIQKAHREVYGYFFKEIEAREIQTPFGTYRGGYAPAVTDPLLVEKQASRENEASTEMAESQFTFAHTPKGMTFERVQQYNKALALDFRIIRSHFEKAVRFAVLEPVVNDLNKIINNDTFSGNMFEINNAWGNEVFRPWLARLATQQTTKPAESKAGREFNKLMNFLRGNANQQIMFMNVVNTIENLTDIPSLMIYINKKEYYGGLKRYIQNPKESANNVKDLSPFMKERMENQIFEINDTYTKLFRDGSKPLNKAMDFRDSLRNNTYIMQQSLQNVVEVSAWSALYDKAIAEGKTETQAVRQADSVIRQIMGSNRPIDLASIEVGNALQRALLTFYSYFLNKGNLYMYSQREKKLQVYALGLAAPAILSALFRRGVKGNFDEDGDDEYIDDLFDVVFLSQLRFVTATVPGGGTATRYIEGQFNDRMYDDRLSLSPMVSLLEGSKGVVNLLTKDEIRARDLRDSLNFFGFMTGLPTGPFGRPIGFMIDLEQGKQQAENPADYTRGLITGRSGKR